MKLLYIKKSPFEIEINLNTLEFMPDADIDERSIIHSSFSLSAKNQFNYLSKFFFPEIKLVFSSHPSIKIQSIDSNCLDYVFLILNKVNDNSDNIIKDIFEIRPTLAFDVLKEKYDRYIYNEIRLDIRKQDLQFLKIKNDGLNIYVEFNLKELSHLNMLQSLDYINATSDAIKEQFETYIKSYGTNEKINIETHPHPNLLIECSTEKTAKYLITLLDKINYQSNYVYEQVLNDESGNLKEHFSSFFNTYIAQEILNDSLPKTSVGNKKKNKV